MKKFLLIPLLLLILSACKDDGVKLYFPTGTVVTHKIDDVKAVVLYCVNNWCYVKNHKYYYNWYFYEIVEEPLKKEYK